MIGLLIGGLGGGNTNPLFGVFVVNAPESIHREKLQFLLGNRLPKVEFKTDKELFEAVFRNASTYLEYCSQIEDGKIVSLTFSGRCFNDKVLSLLDLVPDLAALCSSLRDIRIHATAISAERIERLRQQLPAATIRVLGEKDYWIEKKKELGIKDDDASG